MSKQVWCVMRINSAGNTQVDTIHENEDNAHKATNDPRYKNQHVWVDGPYELKD